MPTPRSIPALFALLLVLVAGCGGSSNSESGAGDAPSVDQLVALLPHDSKEAVTLDVAGAREQVDDRRLQPLVESTVVAFPERDHGPLYRALDASKVSAMVRGDLPEMLLISTTQRWDDARKAFEREGWVHEAQGVLTHPGVAASEMLQYVTGRDGLIVLSGYAPAAIEARDGKAKGSPELRELVDQVDGVARGAKLRDYQCMRGTAIGAHPAGDDGEFVMTLDRPADTGRARPLEPETLDYTFEQPRAEGDRVIVPYRKTGTDDPFGQPAPDAAGDASIWTYDCGTDG